MSYFGQEPDPIPTLYKALMAEGGPKSSDGLYDHCLTSYLQRRDWVAIAATSGTPVEYDNEDGRQLPGHARDHQRIATWRNIKRMLQDGYLCILSYKTTAATYHFAVVYDAFIRKNMHWLRVACSSQGYMEVQAIQFLDRTGTQQIYVKPDDLELR